MQKYNTIVIGAGLTGLTTSFYLKKRGVDFKVLEKEPRVGGVINTVKENGFTYEEGPNTGVIGQPDKLNVWGIQAGETGYKAGDFNLDSQVNNPDKNDIWWPNFGSNSFIPE